jgi:hypothetical protein
MSHGIRRKPFQVLPGGAKVTCVEINDHGFKTEEWFTQSMQGWPLPMGLIDSTMDDWDFVLVVPLISVREYWCGNDGMQAWRHKKTGYVVPDHCRQTGGCPEVWNKEDVRGKKELEIRNLAEVEEFVVLDHSSRARSVFPEHSFQSVSPTFSR